MGILNRQNPQNDSNLDQNNLDINEISIILNMIKETSFKGKDLEAIYNLVIKLQKQYTKLEIN